MIARILTALSIALLTPVCGAQAEPTKNQFWLVGDIWQGMSEGDFFAFAKQNAFEVTTPLPDKSTKSVTIDGTNYWLVFCDGGLTWATWTLTENEAFHRSMDHWLNNQGFQVSEIRVSSDFNDRSNKTMTELTLSLTRPGATFSVTYNQYAENSNIALEDVRYDQSWGCKLDRPN